MNVMYINCPNNSVFLHQRDINLQVEYLSICLLSLMLMLEPLWGQKVDDWRRVYLNVYHLHKNQPEFPLRELSSHLLCGACPEENRSLSAWWLSLGLPQLSEEAILWNWKPKQNQMFRIMNSCVSDSNYPISTLTIQIKISTMYGFVWPWQQTNIHLKFVFINRRHKYVVQHNVLGYIMKCSHICIYLM